MNDLRARLELALAGSYRLGKVLGAGGMASVFAAEDLKHRRQVAIKVLSPELAAAIGPERFVREIETVGRLTHPHILPMFDSGTADGLSYFVMPVVEGESLRARLERERQLGVADAVRLTREVADALTYAHEHHVVHRDVKPENILLAGDHALLADFGVAHAVEGAGRERLTATGMVLGTPLYMSPEQASGARAIDGRCDQYALACVVYEMLAGSPPFTGPTAESLIHQHLSLAPRRVTDLRPGVPARIAQGLERALAKVPGDRYASCAEFAASLASPEPGTVAARPPPETATAVTTLPITATASDPTITLPRPRRRVRARDLALLGLVLTAGLLGAHELLARRAATGIHSLAVLPLENLSGDESQQYFADGMTEELINRLAQIGALTVSSRSSVMLFQGTHTPLPEVAKRLKVAAVVEGTVRRSGNRVRITVQLVNAATDKTLWGSSYERDLADVFTLQSEVAQSIAARIGVTLRSDERDRLAASRRVDPEAHEEYLKGRFQWNLFSEAGFRKALDHFHRALELDPTLALAYVGVSDAYAWLSTLYLPPAEAMPKAAAAAERALALDPELPEAYAARGYVRAFNQWRWREAESDFRRAIALRPGSAVAHFYLGTMLVAFGRFDEAIHELDRAHQLDPLSKLIETAQLYPLFEGRRFEQAITTAERIILEDSLASYATAILAQALIQQGEIERAIPLIRRRMRLLKEFGSGGLAYPHALQGKRALALAELEDLERGEDHYAIALVYSALGMNDEAFSALEREIDLRRETVVFLGVDPQLDALRSDPRFARLLDRMGLPHLPAAPGSKPG